MWPLERVLPTQRWPIVSLCMLFCVIYLMVDFILFVMNVLTAYTGMSHLIVGLTLMVWGSDNMEMLNLAIAIGKGDEEMATIAVLSCQILCCTLVIPIACLSRMFQRSQFEIQVLQAHHTRAQLILPVMGVVMVVLAGYLHSNMHLNRKWCSVFSVVYFAYLLFSVC